MIMVFGLSAGADGTGAGGDWIMIGLDFGDDDLDLDLDRLRLDDLLVSKFRSAISIALRLLPPMNLFKVFLLARFKHQ